MTKVIWYDGKDAYVSPFILRGDGENITEESRNLLHDYMTGNGEILKIEIMKGALTATPLRIPQTVTLHTLDLRRCGFEKGAKHEL